MTTPQEPDPSETNGRPAPEADVGHAPEAAADHVPEAAADHVPEAAADHVPEAVKPDAPAGAQAQEQPATVTMQVDQSSGTEQTKVDQHRPIGTAYGYSPGYVPAPPAAPRYGRPVAQPYNTQSSRGPGQQNFSQPTVRIGGRVQSEPTPPSSNRVRPTRIPRRASLQLRYLEPWSVLKVSLVLSVAGFLAWMVAVGLLYSILGGMGVWDQLNGTYSDLTSVNDPQAGEDLISAGGVFGVAALVGLVNIVLITAMCTVGAFIYNASADLAGGIEVTLSERD